MTDHLARWGVVESDAAYRRLDDLLLVVSELVTNAVKFSPGDIGVGLHAHRMRIEVEVSDSSPEPAVPRTAASTAIGGRGLAMVDVLTSRWGQVRRDRRKTVWAHLDIEPGSVLASRCRLAE